MQGHCHTALFSDGTAAGLRASEKKAGVDLAVVQPVATSPAQVAHINDSVLRINQETASSGMLSFGSIHPGCDRWEQELERLAAHGVPGIKLHPPFEQMDIDSPQTVAVLRKCRELGLIVLTHSGWDIGIPGAAHALPQKIRNALDAAGPLRLIAGHMGGWRCWEETARLLADTGVFLDTAFSLGRLYPAGDGYPWQEQELQMLSDSEFCDLVHLFGADHMLFGSDSPWTDPAEEIRKIRALPLTEKEKAAICGGNAARLLEYA